MKIGIIGAGHIGGTLARRLKALGHDVSIANSRGPDTLKELATETGAKPVTVEQAARAGDVVINTIPEKNVPRLPADLFDGVDGGGLDESWRQQPATPVYGTDFDAGGVRKALAEATRERVPEFSAGGGT